MTNKSIHGGFVFEDDDGKIPGPNHLTNEVANVIIESLRNGCSYEQAAGRAGVGRSTIFNWNKIGRKVERDIDNYFNRTTHEQRCYQIMVAVREAVGNLQNDLVSLVMQSAKNGKIDDAKYLLEKRFAKDFGILSNVVEETKTVETVDSVEVTELYTATKRAIMDDIDKLKEESDEMDEYGGVEVVITPEMMSGYSGDD